MAEMARVPVSRLSGVCQLTRSTVIQALVYLGLVMQWTGVATASDQDKSLIDAQDCVPRAALDAYVERSILRKAEVFRAFPAASGGIVMLGSSIVEEGPWKLMFPGINIVNRGISADTTRGVLSRLDEVISLQPRQVVLYIGGNDFSRENRSVEATSESLSQIIEALTQALPDLDIVVMTLFPREKRHAPKIRAYNAYVHSLQSDGVRVLDLFDAFAQPSGAIRPELTNDNIHLLGDAYKMWGKALRPLLLLSGGSD